MQVDDLDEAILWELARDAMQTNKALAARLGVAPSTTLNRIRVLRDSGVLGGAHADIDVEALGFHIQALVFVRLRPQARPRIAEFAEKVAHLAHTMSVFFLGGPEDFAIHLYCTTSRQLRDIVATQLSMDPDVASTSTHVVFDHLSGNQRMAHVSGFEDVRAPIPAAVRSTGPVQR